MINVYSFQKINSPQQCSHPKNISKTSHFTFGQNYKKLVSNSKANFDFRKFLQKNHNNKRSLGTKQQFKRNPLQQISSSEANVQSLLQNKAFKIRCYSKKPAKEIEKLDQQVTISRLVKYKPKIYESKQIKIDSTIKKDQVNNKKCIRMHKFDNFEELQPIANNIKIAYNSEVSQCQYHSQKALVIDLNYLMHCIKLSTIKANEKQRQKQYFRKKMIYMLKRIIEQRYCQFPLERTRRIEKPQIIFKVNKDQQIFELIKEFEACQFTFYYCIFSIQNKFVQNVSLYNLTKIKNLAQNIVFLDTHQNFINNPPLINSRHFVAFISFSQKCNIINSIDNLFFSLENLQIRFSAQQFQIEQEKKLGQIHEIPVKQFLEKVKQRKLVKNCKKSSRQKKDRCQSSYQSSYVSQQLKKQQRTLQNFKQKILKYLKIVGSENNSLQTKKSKQISYCVNSTNNDQFQCLTGRQQCSKTNYQIVSQLIRLNSHVHKQISNYLRKMDSIQIQNCEERLQTIDYLRFQKIYVNMFQ